LEPERFEYAPIDERWALMKLVGRIGAEGLPDGTQLILRRGRLLTSYPMAESHMIGSAEGRMRRSDSGLLLVASFDVPLEAVSYPDAAFEVTACSSTRVALPAPRRQLTVAEYGALDARRGGRQRLTAIAAAVAMSTACGSVVGIAAADSPAGSDTPVTTTVTTGTTDTATTPAPDTTTAASTPAPPPPTVTDATTATSTPAPPPPTVTATTTAASTPAPPPPTAPDAKTIASMPAPPPPTATHTTSDPSPISSTVPTTLARSTPRRTTSTAPPPARHRRPISARLGHIPSLKETWGGAATADHRGKASKQARFKPAQSELAKPELTTALPVGVTFWNGGIGLDPITAAELTHFTSLTAEADQPPAFLIPIYKAAARRYHVPWQILAAINAIETNYGRDLNISSKGAIGWMQFMPAIWHEFGVAVDGHGTPNPYDPRDAIFAAAHYLSAHGARHDVRGAVFAYNHAGWYVDAVMWWSRTIKVASDRRAPRRRGYALPLDGRYLQQLGRTDDGIDIEAAPDGAAVYSITPGVVTAVADDPGGFGPNYPVILATAGPLAGRYVYYGHVAASLVRVGQRVSAGQPIAVIGHTGDAAGLDHGHIEIGFSNGSGDPLDHHGSEAWTATGAAMRHVVVTLSAASGIKNGH
jgi:hypothetical protein